MQSEKIIMKQQQKKNETSKNEEKKKKERAEMKKVRTQKQRLKKKLKYIEKGIMVVCICVFNSSYLVFSTPNKVE